MGAMAPVRSPASRLRWVCGLLVVVAAVLLAGCGSGEGGPSGRLLGGGLDAYKARLADARGRPVVVNQWASWCGPCRAEFPYFQQLARKYDSRVVFIGVNSRDSRDGANEFLAQFPTPFEHFEDPDAEIARSFRGGRAWPTTAFYTADGKLNYTHQGSYRDESDLERDIVTYAIDG